MSADLFQNKYRIPSARLRDWNYGSEGMYFVTACTINREHYFGSIAQDIMQFSELGQAAHDAWLQTPALRPDMNLQLGEFQVMPNHFHAILVIGQNDFNSGAQTRDAMHCVSTANKFGPQSKNLGSVMRGFKSAVTTSARVSGFPFQWQERFYDHIIRSYEEYLRISTYIVNNVRNWAEDRFYNG